MLSLFSVRFGRECHLTSWGSSAGFSPLFPVPGHSLPKQLVGAPNTCSIGYRDPNGQDHSKLPCSHRKGACKRLTHRGKWQQNKDVERNDTPTIPPPPEFHASNNRKLGSGPAVVHFVDSSAIPFPEISIPLSRGPPRGEAQKQSDNVVVWPLSAVPTNLRRSM